MKYYNPFSEEIEIEPIQDVDAREKEQTIGYYAMFEYLNGFKKVLYWSKKQMLKHADRYSPAFSAAAYAKIQKGEIDDKDMWKYSSFWYKDFDGMAKKTMLRQLISKWGVMSTEMQTAYESDNKVARITDSGNFEVIEIEEETAPEPEKTAENAVSLTEVQAAPDEISIDEL